ncbi:MAG TPA: ADP-forming succinate--CoA ligase subunit beta [Thermoplasmata archaeon]|jgi:succinyl-CoA synthetase beta subunit|nr:ADP-forming succinate--CoA ligase subunit beta [Thermoplasmata archaeon]
MKFYEYKAHEILRKYGIPVPRGILATTPEDIVDPPLPCAVKAQVLIGGRGKAGGIKFAKTVEEARTAAGAILGMHIGPYTVRQVYAQELLDIAQELYLSITIDRSARAPLLMASSAGGMEIESVPPEKILRIHIPPLVGLQPYVLRNLAKGLALKNETSTQVTDIVKKLYALFRGEDAELVEINPLAVLKDGRVVAGDAKLVVDDNAEYRHPEYADLPQDRTPLEEEAHDKGITFIQLEGDIGVIANGAGLTMATLDVLNLKGGKGGTFLDLGGTDDPEKVKQAFEILLKAKPSAIFLNIFGGITKADTVAIGVTEAIQAFRAHVPVVARIKGVNEVRAKEILAGAGMHSVESMEEGAELAVKLRGSR